MDFSIIVILKIKHNSMNLNEFAKKITLKEGGKKSLSIAQVKEVIRLVFDELRKHPFDTIVELFFTSKKNKKSPVEKK